MKKPGPPFLGLYLLILLSLGLKIDSMQDTDRIWIMLVSFSSTLWKLRLVRASSVTSMSRLLNT